MKHLIICILLSTANCFSQNTIIKKVNNYIKNKEDITKNILFISIIEQNLYHITNNKIIKIYNISSSKYGTGNTNGSNKTPIGLHKIANKYGDQTPTNGKMVGRVYTGEIATIYLDKTKSKTDDVTSRILWLEGVEKGKNKGKGIDSFKRYIYIHGTSEEGRIGTPASHGCIRMKNKDVIDLYNKVSIGTLVLIL